MKTREKKWKRRRKEDGIRNMDKMKKDKKETNERKRTR